MNKSILVCFVLLALACSALADIYCHNPRGSNNKLNEENTNAQNQNRLFDSQNNARGGYQWGPAMTFYTGSLLQLEWTAQHGCGSDQSNTDCNFVLQYMCGPWIRDGTEQGTPNTIGTDNGGVNVVYNDGDSLLSGARGQHEPLTWYVACRTRSRNRGLFIADNNIGNPATRTRQNNNGNRHGFECPEEKDYYPYWTPTPWKDIAVLTSKTSRCKYYRKNSQNSAKKGLCITAGSPKPNQDWDNTLNIPELWKNQAEQWEETACKAAGNQWYEIKSWGLPKPDCFAPAESRDNHLGNVYLASTTTMTQTYKWVIPSVDNDPGQSYATCVFRVRYNISSEDYMGFREVDSPKQGMIDARFNGVNSPVRNNPTINYGTDAQGFLRNLTLAINTDQFGRTFSDRSHAFKITKRPSNLAPGARIYNLNVRGRRGNIVQAYPGVECDFTPNNLEVTKADYIHFQWTGSDHNAANQAGQGRDKTDRHNLVPIKKTKGKNARANYPGKLDQATDLFEAAFAYRLAHLDQPAICTTAGQTGCCLPDAQLGNGNPANDQQNLQNCNYLNAASAYFNSRPVRPKSTGTYYFMATRNNSFTNRSQKLTIKVSELLSPVALTGIAIGSAGFIGAAVIGGGVWYSQSHTTSAAANVFGSIKI